MTSRIIKVRRRILEPDSMLHSAIDLHQVIIAEVGLLKSTLDNEEGQNSLAEIEQHIIRSASLVRKARSFYRRNVQF